MAVTVAWRKAAVSSFVLALIGLQAWAVVGRFDDWPFAANAMFSYSRTPDEPVYSLSLLRFDRNDAAHIIDPVRDLDAPSDLEFGRMFFGRWYRSTDPGFAQRGLAPAEPGDVNARLLVFCRAVSDELRLHHDDAEEIEVAVAEVRRDRGTWTVGAWRAVVTYDVARDTLVKLAAP